MVQNAIGEILTCNGFQFRQGSPGELGIYYKYHGEGFTVVLTAELRQGYTLTPQQHDIAVERVKGRFYQPGDFLTDFPGELPVYHVEVLTLLITDAAEQVREMGAQCRNVWVYLSTEGRLIVYENQPGEFYGLRHVLERGLSDAAAGKSNSANVRTAGEIRRLPLITVGLIAVNVLVYLVLELLGDTQDGGFIAFYGGMYPPFLIEDHQWWRLFTAGFLHFGASHLVNNMVILFFMGERMERAVGHLRMLIVYLASLLGGSMLSFGMMLYTGDYAVSAGASGAVFGIIGGFLWVVLLHRGRVEDITTRRLLFMIALSVYYGFSSGGIDNWGHIGGIMTGFAVSMILYHGKLQKY